MNSSAINDVLSLIKCSIGKKCFCTQITVKKKITQMYTFQTLNKKTLCYSYESCMYWNALPFNLHSMWNESILFFIIFTAILEAEKTV